MGALSVKKIARYYNKSKPIRFKGDKFYKDEPQLGSLKLRLTWLNKKCIADILGKWPFGAGSSLTKLMPKLLTCDFNSEMCMSVTTNTDGVSLIVEGRFYTESDFGVLKWDSENELSHPYFKFPANQPDDKNQLSKNYDFSDIILEFDYEIEGELPHLYEEATPSLKLISTDGNEYEVRLWLYDTKRPIDNWEFARRPPPLPVSEEAINTDLKQPDKEFEDDFARKWTWPEEGRQAGYQKGNSGHIRLDFNNLYSGWDKFVVNPDRSPELGERDEKYWVEPNESKKIEPSNIKSIKSIQWGFKPRDYVPLNEANGNYKPLSNSQWFRMSFRNWRVTGSNFARGMPNPLSYHLIRLADNYDDAYRFTPQWLIEQYYTLGFRDSINLFVGVSRFYNKEMKNNDSASGSILNDGFRAWFANYLQAAKSFNFSRVTVSISMENVDAPEYWVQKYWDGSLATTSEPRSAKLLSFCNPSVQNFYKRFIDEITTLQHEFDLDISIQLNQPQWWKNNLAEFDSPSFYDTATRDKHQNDIGRSIPNIEDTGQDINDNELLLETITWLQKQNGDFTLLLRNHLRERWPDKETKFSVLFSVPSVLDETLVSPIMRSVNFPKEQWVKLNNTDNLDLVCLSDYDYLIKIAENNEEVRKEFQEKHAKVYSIANEMLGYPAEQSHYFIGLVPQPNSQLRGVINQAIKDGLDRNLEPYVWAGTQVFYDGWLPSKVLAE
jgi:hypothetical protein